MRNRSSVDQSGTMKTTSFTLALMALFATTSTMLAQAPNWQLVWSDEFNGPGIDRRNWNFDTGGSGWGNNELQFYTDRSSNSFIAIDPGSGNSCLVIQALKER